MTTPTDPNLDPSSFDAGNSSRVHFTVASALLRELGERLVSKPHIALAELIKNSYDADAEKVVIRIGQDRIEVSDNGHGMTKDEFRDYWMRVGSPHKEEERYSKYSKRPMTGSKGVGRLSAQFLARKQVLATVAKEDTRCEQLALVNWSEAVAAGDLTEAVALYRETPPSTPFPSDSEHGTSVVLTDLNQEWTEDAVAALAREIWWLQPPFRSNPRLSTDQQKAFEIELETARPELARAFDTNMRAIMSIWHARIHGRLTNGTKAPVIQLTLEYPGETPIKHEFSPTTGDLHSLEFEIRIYHLQRRQPQGISVSAARDYMNRFGGVHVYDGGFHLPYYGRPETDWLETEITHSHRLSRSELLPEELQVPEGLSYLPTLSRMIGVVHVDTAREGEIAKKAGTANAARHLQIQVTRDRLVDNAAYQILRDVVRYAIDFYAMQEARRSFEAAESQKDAEPVSRKLERVEEVLETFSSRIDKPVFKEIKQHLREAIRASETEAELTIRQVALLGPLATAGITALATVHETGQQVGLLEDIIGRLQALRPGDKATKESLAAVVRAIKEWLERFRATRRLFGHLMDAESRENPVSVRAKPFLEDLRTKIDPLRRGTVIEVSVDEGLRLPKGAVAEWTALFQNVLLNALNATLDTAVKRIDISSRVRGQRSSILVQDTGVGVDLEDSEELFRPFERHLEISPERRALGLGGSGLGLTIVRLIASNLGCRVRFVEPTQGYRTAFELSWRES